MYAGNLRVEMALEMVRLRVSESPPQADQLSQWGKNLLSQDNGDTILIYIVLYNQRIACSNFLYGLCFLGPFFLLSKR